jgi:hypothetical protein
VTSSAQIAFLSVSGVIVFASLLVWIPFRSARSPLAIFDLGSTFSVIAPLSAMSVGVIGLPLWLGGAGGLAAGLSAALLVHSFRHRAVGASETKLVLLYALSFAFFSVSTVAGTLSARWVASL